MFNLLVLLVPLSSAAAIYRRQADISTDLSTCQKYTVSEKNTRVNTTLYEHKHRQPGLYGNGFMFIECPDLNDCSSCQAFYTDSPKGDKASTSYSFFHKTQEGCQFERPRKDDKGQCQVEACTITAPMSNTVNTETMTCFAGDGDPVLKDVNNIKAFFVNKTFDLIKNLKLYKQFFGSTEISTEAYPGIYNVCEKGIKTITADNGSGPAKCLKFECNDGHFVGDLDCQGKSFEGSKVARLVIKGSDVLSSLEFLDIDGKVLGKAGSERDDHSKTIDISDEGKLAGFIAKRIDDGDLKGSMSQFRPIFLNDDNEHPVLFPDTIGSTDGALFPNTHNVCVNSVKRIHTSKDKFMTCLKFECADGSFVGDTSCSTDSVIDLAEAQDMYIESGESLNALAFVREEGSLNTGFGGSPGSSEATTKETIRLSEHGHLVGFIAERITSEKFQGAMTKFQPLFL